MKKARIPARYGSAEGNGVPSVSTAMNACISR